MEAESIEPGTRFETFTVEGRYLGPRPPGLKVYTGSMWTCRCACGLTFLMGYRSLKNARPLNRCSCWRGRSFALVTKANKDANKLALLYRSVKRKREGFEWPDFQTFLATVDAQPSAQHHFTRKDPKQPWGPNNWKWVYKPYSKNKKITLLSCGGRTQDLQTWAFEYGLNYQTLYGRINTKGWSIEKALSEPIKNHTLPI